MTVSTMLDKILGKQRYATVDDIRDLFGDYHNALHWFAGFLTADEKLIDACIVDACTIAHTQTPIFHEWLVYWAARATVRTAFQREQACIAELAPEYRKSEPVDRQLPPLSAEYLRLLVKNSDGICARLDVLCRFVLVLRGIAKDPVDNVAAQLRISPSAVERAYAVACETLELISRGMPGDAGVPACRTNNELTLAGSTA